MKIHFYAIPSQKKVLETVLQVARFSRLWQEYSRLAIRSIEHHSGLTFKQAHIKVYVGDNIQTHSGDKGKGMQISYNHNKVQHGNVADSDYEIIIHILHELSHRILIQNNIISIYKDYSYKRNLISHRRIYLFLYDVMSDVLGKDVANKEVAFEKRHLARSFGDAWDWALQKTYNERQRSLLTLRHKYRV